MNGHVTTWLGLYHDGELHGRQLQQVEVHLAHCATCRAEVERLRALGALLQETSVPEGLTPPERFVAQVGLRLPRRPAQPASQRALRMGWRLVPLGLLGAWAFVQAVSIVAGAVLVALQMGLGGELVARWLPAAGQGLPLAEIAGLADASLSEAWRAALQLWARAEPWYWIAVLNIGSLVAIGLAYWSWLASWWARQQRHQIRV